MDVEWAKFCRTPDLAVDEPHINVTFRDARRHRVTVEELSDEYQLRAYVARQSLVEAHPNLPLQIWMRNRAVSLVGFRIDHRRRLVGEVWIPKAGITESEFQLYVRTLAVESDRFEYALTGRDSE